MTPVSSPSASASASVSGSRRGRQFGIVWKAAAAITIAFAAFMILVHMKTGRRLLGFSEKCPFIASSADIEAARLEAVRATAGTTLAPSRPALGFELERSKPADVKAWAARAGATCTEQREGTLLKCLDVPSAAMPPGLPGPNVSEVVFAFEPTGMTLVNIAAYLIDAREDVASARLRGLRDHLRGVLGAGQELGEFDDAYLAGGDGRMATVTYRFSNYQVDLSAMRQRAGQVILREHYIAGAPPAPAKP